MQMLSKEMLNGSWSEVRFGFIHNWNYWIDHFVRWIEVQPLSGVWNMKNTIDQMYSVELAKLDDGSLVYGSVEEIEAHADQHDRFVTDYLDHMSPAHVQKFGKYVGKSLTDPYSVGGTHSRKMDYNLGRIVVTEKF